MKKLNKRTAALVVCLAIIVVLATVLAVAKACNKEPVPEKPDDETPNDTPITEVVGNNGEKTYVFPNIKEKADVVSLEVFKGKNLVYTIKYNQAIGAHLLSGYEHMLYNEGFEKILDAVCTLEIKEKINDPISDEEYSVSPETALYTIMITDKSQSNILYVGDELVSGRGYYCKLADSQDVFYVNYAVEKLFKDNNSLLSGQLQDPVDSSRYHYMEEFVLYKELKPFVSVKFVPEVEREDGDAYGYYQMTYPTSYAVSDINYDTALRSLINPFADSVVTTEITEESIEKYGFAVPSYEVEYTLDGKKHKIYFGNRTDDGSMIYVMSDYGFIGLAVVEEKFPFLNYELVDYINPYLFGLNIKMVSRVSVSGQGFSDRYILSHTENDLVVTEEISNAVIDTQNFRNFYRDLLMLEMKDTAQKAVEENWKLTFVIETVGGKIYEYKFYHTSERECYYTIDGKGEFYVDIADIEKIISDAGKLSRGETVDPEAHL